MRWRTNGSVGRGIGDGGDGEGGVRRGGGEIRSDVGWNPTRSDVAGLCWRLMQIASPMRREEGGGASLLRKQGQ